jgi:hypothetical protein
MTWLMEVGRSRIPNVQRLGVVAACYDSYRLPLFGRKLYFSCRPEKPPSDQHSDRQANEQHFRLFSRRNLHQSDHHNGDVERTPANETMTEVLRISLCALR